MSSSGERAALDPAGCPPWSVGPEDEEPSTAAMEEQADERIDHFDRLPDSVLLVVFNRIGDVKALGRCCVVSRRFQALVPLVDDVVVRVDCVISDDPSPSSSSSAFSSSSSSSSVSATSTDKARGVFSHLARLVLGGIVKPLHALGQILTPSYVSSSGGAASASQRSSTCSSSSSSSSSSSTSSEVSHHSPTEVLRSFKEIRRLRIELPAGELGVDEGVLLKWKADFGSTLDRCTILGASSVLSASPSSPSAAFPTSPKSPTAQDVCGGVDDTGSIPESFYSNGSLKLRVVWTISSLIAASARHYLLQPIIAEHETLESLDLTDTDGQGVLTMNRRQLQELKVKPVSASGNSQRTLVPALSMRLWYAAHMELPGGVVLKGATLVAIRPTEERAKEASSGSGSNGGSAVGSSDGCWISDAFQEPYKTAAKMLMKRRTYCLEMNSF